jgi:hypothetical protein
MIGGIAATQSAAFGSGFQNTPENVTIALVLSPCWQAVYQAIEAPIEKPPITVLSGLKP